jgi:hypothetical protein
LLSQLELGGFSSDPSPFLIREWSAPRADSLSSSSSID